jgi:hypothetical protein
MTKREPCPANHARAMWAGQALWVFSTNCGLPLNNDEDTADCIADLIGDLMHYAEKRGLDPVEIARKGIGMWSAESRHQTGEPGANDTVNLAIIREDERRD